MQSNIEGTLLDQSKSSSSPAVAYLMQWPVQCSWEAMQAWKQQSSPTVATALPHHSAIDIQSSDVLHAEVKCFIYVIVEQLILMKISEVLNS